MDNNKLHLLFHIMEKIDENNTRNELDIIKLLFKRILFIKEEIKYINDLWFETQEIKNDVEYYQLIISLIDTFIKYCSDKKSFKEDLLSKEIFSIFKNTKYFSIYCIMIEMSKLFGLAEQNYAEISCGLYILGSKKETPVNKYLIKTLKDFTQDEIIKNSSFFNQIDRLKYENINDSFMKNLLGLYKLIFNKGDEEQIKFQINLLDNPEEYKEQRISSISINFENIDNQENTFSNGFKNSQNISPIKEKDNSKNNKKSEIKLEEYNEENTFIMINEKEPLEENNRAEDVKSIEKKNEVIYEKIIQNYKEDEDIVNREEKRKNS